MGAEFKYGITVNDVDFVLLDEKNVATKIVASDKEGKDRSINWTENDLLFITNGSMTENSGYGDNKTPATFNTEL